MIECANESFETGENVLNPRKRSRLDSNVENENLKIYEKMQRLRKERNELQIQLQTKEIKIEELEKLNNDFLESIESLTEHNTELCKKYVKLQNFLSETRTQLFKKTMDLEDTKDLITQKEFEIESIISEIIDFQRRNSRKFSSVTPLQKLVQYYSEKVIPFYHNDTKLQMSMVAPLNSNFKEEEHEEESIQKENTEKGELEGTQKK